MRVFDISRLMRIGSRLMRIGSPAPAPQVLPAPPPLAGAFRLVAARLPVDPPPPAPEPRPAYTGPASGRMIWTGRLPKGVALSIDGQNASTGYLTGRLPGVPVRITVQPAKLSSRGLTVFTANESRQSARESAGPQNGWKPTAYEWEPRRARNVSVLEQPAPGNGWKKLVLRGGNEPLSVIVVDWSVAPAEHN